MSAQGTEKKLFISHSHSDAKVAEAFDSLVSTAIEGLQDEQIMRTSGQETGVHPGAYITPELIESIRTCNAFIALISEAYLNSPYCLMEYAAWLGAHKERSPIPLGFPGLNPNNMPGMLSGAKFVEISHADGMRNALERIADHGNHEGWKLRKDGKYAPQLAYLNEAAKQIRPCRWTAEKFMIRDEKADFLNAYGLKEELREDHVLQDFSRKLSRNNIVQFTWADPINDNWIKAKWRRAEESLRISFHRAPGGFGCNVSLRPSVNKAVLTQGRSKLCIEARVSPGSKLKQIGLLVRLVNGYMQHWRYAEDDNNLKHLIIPEGENFSELSLDLITDQWNLFSEDGTVRRGPSKHDFSVIASVNLEPGSSDNQDGLGDVGRGDGIIDIRRIWLE